MHNSNSQQWIDVMKNEMKSMQDNDGNIERYKTRLAPKDFIQMEDINYKETFSLVSSKDSFRTIMTLVTHFDLELYQMDIKIVLLNGDFVLDD
ncbi:Copia protein, partial [Mucuna pruriens]